MVWIDFQPTLKSEDIGRHLDAVENLLQQHSLIESQLNNLSDRVKRLNQRALPYKKSLHPEAQILQKRLEPLNKEFEKLVFFRICCWIKNSSINVKIHFMVDG